jgi:CubicO group peptidase (beta-lactamase class C family)
MEFQMQNQKKRSVLLLSLCFILFSASIPAQQNKYSPLPSTYVATQSLDKNKISKIEQLVKSYADIHMFNGSILVANKGQILLKKGYGLANMEWNIPNAIDTKFRIGSVTKQFTAMLIMQLKQAGKLNLQAKITEYLPWYRKDTGNKITIHHLLTHTSGIPNYTENASTIADINTHNYTPVEIAEKYCSAMLEFEPGTKFKYSNSAYFLLGVIIEAITKKLYAQVLKEQILDVAGMKNTGIDTPSEIVKNRALGYEYSFEGYVNSAYIDMASATYAAGAIYSTIEDLYLWQKALYGDKLLSKENKEIMFTPYLNNYAYGLAVNKSKPEGMQKEITAMGHPGGINGFSALSIRYIEDETVIILLDNTRVGKRGNLENIGLGIFLILNDLPPAKPKQSLQVAMIEKIRNSTIEELLAFYRHIKNAQKDAYDFTGAESLLNNLGYFLLGKGRIKDSIAILKLAVEEYPLSSNTYDTYGEALMKDGQKELAIKNYKRSLELNPKNTNAVQQLKILESQP